ncbi:PREDICTED: putative protein TPRXL [Nicotiana attenuata]|uniref:putative protein TPRXL n=1 Tax=Nicotiana attenuata TaxID=49451 RepID=UPI0009057BA1|nr:PREDICTED: putative protein TPRXL [Nicotiana attenuata]
MAPRGKDRPEGNAPENVKKRKKTKASGNLGITTSPPHAPASSHVPPPTCPLSFPPPLYSIPHLGYKAPSSTPFFNPTSSQHIPGLRPGVPSLSTYPVMSSSSSPVIPSFSSSGIQSSFSPIIHSSSSSSMPSLFSQPARYSSMPSSKSTPLSHGIPSSSYSFLPSSSSPVIHSSSSTGMPSSFSHPTSQPASHSSMPLSGSTPSSSPSISRPHIGVNSNLTFQYTDSDTATQPPAQTSTRSQNPPNVGKYDDLRRLIIVSDGAGFYPPQATKAVVESMCSFYHAPYRFWSEVPTNIRDRMFAEFRLKCAWSRDSEAEERAVFFKKCSDRLPDLLRTA